MRHPIDPSALPEGARRVLGGPAPLKMMAARGMMPLPPVVLLCTLYGLAHGPDHDVRDVAAASLANLPDPVLNAVFASSEVPGGVLDDLADRVADKRAVLERVVRHGNTPGETVARVAKRCDEMMSEVIATNEQRLLAHPEIVEALYMNERTRMSTADRVVEFAARNGLTLKIPGFESIVAALKDQLIPEPSDEPLPSDEDFVETLREAEDVPLDAIADEEEGDGYGIAAGTDESVAARARKVEKKMEEMSVTEKIRTAMLGNSMQRALLIRATNKLVAAAVLDSPKLGDDEVIKFAASRQVSEDVLRRIAGRGAFLRLYDVKHNLVNNPKTPVAESLKLLNHLRESDVKKLLTSKNVPSAVRQAAQGLINKRRRKN
ncbi:MAG: hypothetical protein R3A52_29030 [Polyangiales bacterium]